MAQVILNDPESKQLARAVRHLTIRSRTGELGIVHGADRFVSTNDCFRKVELEQLELALRKLGIDLSKV
jgi:hypothetical protein